MSSSEIFKTWGPYFDNYHLSLLTVLYHVSVQLTEQATLI